MKLMEGMKSVVYHYADDTSILSSHPPNQPVDVTKLQADLDRVTQWSKTWMMPLNLDKCCTMAFGNSPSPTPTDGAQLAECTSTTLLSVLLTSDLR